MQLQQLTVNNIRSYTHHEVSFPKGIVVLRGDIGSGKSSLLYAIEFAFFGLAGSNGAGLLKHGTSKGSVTLHFTINGRELVVHRTLQKTKASIVQGPGSLTINGVTEQLTPTEIKAKIHDLFGYPKGTKSSLYRYTVFTPQEQMKEIVTTSAEQRIATLRQVFAMDKYKRAIDNCAIVIAMCKEKAAEIQGKITVVQTTIAQLQQRLETFESTSQQYNQIKKQVQELQLQAEQHKKQGELLQQEVQTAEIAHAQWTQIHQQQQELLSKQQTIDTVIQTKQQRVDAYVDTPVQEVSSEHIKQAQVELQKVQQEYEVQQKTYNEQLVHYQTITQQHKQLQQQTQTLQEQKNLLETLTEKTKALAELQDKVKTHEQDMQSLRMQQVSLQEKKVTDLNDTCPTCEQSVSESHKQHLKHSIEQHNADVKQKQQKYQETLNQTQQHITELQARIQQLQQLEQQRTAVAARVEQLEISQKQLQELTLVEAPKPIDATQKTIAQQQLTTLQEQLLQWMKYKEAKQLHQQHIQDINTLLEQQKDNKEHIQKLSVQKAELSAKAKRRDELVTKIQAHKQQQQHIQNQLLELTKQKERLGQQLAQAKELGKQLHEAHEHAKQLNTDLHHIQGIQNWIVKPLRETFSNIERQVMLSIYREFNSYFSLWCSLLISDEQTHIRLDNEFTPIVEQDGYTVDIQNLSGGERTSVALAYRLALNRVINNVVGHIKTSDIMLLDEPTDGFSTQQLNNVRDVLRNLALQQLIIVSHEPLIESFADNVIHVNKQSGTSSTQ